MFNVINSPYFSDLDLREMYSVHANCYSVIHAACEDK
jgi:hypothetical protein